MSTEPIKNPGLARPGFFMLMQFLFGIPEALLPVDDAVVFDLYALTFESFLHGSRCLEQLAGAEFPGFVHDAVCRYALLLITAAHCPADHSCTSFVAKIGGNGAIGSRTACGDLPYHVINVIEKVISLFHARLRGLVVSRRFLRKAGDTNPLRMHGSAGL